MAGKSGRTKTAGTSESTNTRSRREEIVKQAANLFDRVGYHQASMESLAEAVEVSKPTLYHYYSSKHEILTGIHQEFIQRLIERQERRREACLPARVSLLEIMTDILDLMETHRGYVRVFFEHHRELPAAEKAAVIQQRQHYRAMVEDEVRRGIRDGELRDTNAPLATLALFGMCNWAYQWYSSEGPLGARDIASFLWDVWMNGMAVSARPTPSSTQTDQEQCAASTTV